MKKLFLLFFAVVSHNLYAQVKVEGVDINELGNVKYVEIVGVQKFLSNKLTIAIDYGQKFSWGTDQRIEREDGKPIIFNSMVEALNFMNVNGWEFVNNYIVTIGNSQNVYHYLLKRKEPATVVGN